MDMVTLAFFLQRGIRMWGGGGDLPEEIITHIMKIRHNLIKYARPPWLTIVERSTGQRPRIPSIITDTSVHARLILAQYAVWLYKLKALILDIAEYGDSMLGITPEGPGH